ncbi:phosphotransferase family protein [Mycolicibacterium mengxianglii]|uniref:phosphotransferase family protein n=1 Tax=Mycolicibacterium mengxianglii TaxID=2736649 RepID=UPI0018EEDF51|nr:phosphotransferase family protein [Mycolicibacterium mengxianglii]
MPPTTSDTLTDHEVAALARWVRAQGIGSDVEGVEPLTGGTQNIVVRLTIDGQSVVLRRPPLHPRPNSNRTMQREIAVLTTLADSGVPHPRFVKGCEDLDVLGVVFYLMEDVDGFNPGTEVADAYVQDPRMRYQVGLNYAADLARLGRAQWRGLPLESLQRPGSFLARQVPGFVSLLDSYGKLGGYSAEALPAVGELAQWLQDNRPPDTEPGIMHGDAHLNNVLLRRGRPEVAAFVDWEMCTVGDPLLDLGWILVCWPHDPDPINAGAELAALGGLPERTELLEAYRAAGGRNTQNLDWYIAMACFKLAIVIEGTYARYLAGLAHREAGERLHDNAANLIRLGGRVAAGDHPFS